MSNKCLLQIFLSVQHWEGSYLRVVLIYVCLRYLQLKLNPYDDGNNGDDDGGDYSQRIFQYFSHCLTCYNGNIILCLGGVNPSSMVKVTYDQGTSQSAYSIPWPSNKFKDGHLKDAEKEQ